MHIHRIEGELLDLEDLIPKDTLLNFEFKVLPDYLIF